LKSAPGACNLSTIIGKVVKKIALWLCFDDSGANIGASAERIRPPNTTAMRLAKFVEIVDVLYGNVVYRAA
jgi:hypothetical protein